MIRQQLTAAHCDGEGSLSAKHVHIAYEVALEKKQRNFARREYEPGLIWYYIAWKKNVEFGNLIPGKFSVWREIFAILRWHL